MNTVAPHSHPALDHVTADNTLNYRSGHDN